MKTNWDPQQYARFARERRLPFDALLGLVQPDTGMRVVDLGCGNGPLTLELAERFRDSHVVGVDSSAEMLASAEAARATAAAEMRERVSFELGTIERYRPAEPLDLVFSNAALHWVDEHAEVFARLSRWLAPGGQLAVQMPCNESHASHRIAASVAAEEPFAARIGANVRRSPVLAPEAYAELLDDLGYEQQCVRLEVFGHHLPTSADVVEWVRGSLLTHYEAALGAELFPRFVERYRERLLASIGELSPYFYTYRRVLIWGRRAH